MKILGTGAASCCRASQLCRRVVIQGSTAKLSEMSRRMSTTPSDPVVNQRLAGKVAIITGGGSGIGAAFAKLFAAHGAQVVIADIADENGEHVARELGSHGHFTHCNVAEENDIAATVDFAVEKFGKLDIMCNNAGIFTPYDNFETLDLGSTYDHSHSIMVRGVLAGIKHAARAMIPAKQGVILNTASGASAGVSKMIPIVYNMAKKFVPDMTQVAASQLGQHGIRVNAISPHIVLTPLVTNLFKGTPMTKEIAEKNLYEESLLRGRICSEADIANGALFLCSDDSAFISGQNLMIDSGWTNQIPETRGILEVK